MVLLGALVLEVLPLDAVAAAAAEAAVELVVVPVAVRLVVEHVERGRREGLLAGRADEAGLVVPPCQPAVRAGDGLAGDWESA